ncbi:MAG TPA: hypothetical protein VK092_09745, partial [Deinococcales bacterium]|nr:hypothetical protein [Deinococcales bacterium]
MPFHPVADENRFLGLLTGLATLESPTGHTGALDALAGHLQEQLEQGGWHVQRHPRSGAGDHLEATRWTGTAGPSTLLLCHYDTVWDIGTLADMPVRREGNIMYG